jgi:glucose/arabinose dehydrogenase
VKNGVVLAAPFLDLASEVSGSGEQGLLSLAFHPDYGANGLFYVNFTGNDGNTRVERYAVSADPDVADGGSAKLILTVPQPASNHNGGHILFGPDGMLYVALIRTRFRETTRSGTRSGRSDSGIRGVSLSTRGKERST